MADPIAYLNGKLLPYREAFLRVYDLGLVQGATVTERLRTVRHQPALVKEHLDRLEQSLDLVGWSALPTRRELEQAIADVAAHNATLIGPDDDLSVVLFVTPGPFFPDVWGLVEPPGQPTVCVHATPLPQSCWEPLYREGVHLYTPEIRHIPPECLDPRIKQRSRLSWHLADRQVRAQDPLGMALLLDMQGYVTETNSGNLFVVSANRLYTPTARNTLGGITQQAVMELAREAGLEVQRVDLTIQDVIEADEAFLTSSTYLVMPATRCNGQNIGTGLVGELTTQLGQLLRARLGIPL